MVGTARRAARDVSCGGFKRTGRQETGTHACTPPCTDCRLQTGSNTSRVQSTPNLNAAPAPAPCLLQTAGCPPAWPRWLVAWRTQTSGSCRRSCLQVREQHVESVETAQPGDTTLRCADTCTGWGVRQASSGWLGFLVCQTDSAGPTSAGQEAHKAAGTGASEALGVANIHSVHLN